MPPGAASEGLVLVRVVAGSNELVQVRISDGEERPLTSTPDREETWPYWSQPAETLVFQVSAGARDSELALWSPGAGERSLTATPDREERWPAWAPDTPRLVWAFRGGSPGAGLALADLRSGARELLARTGVRDFFFRPSWSPDGRRLVVQRRRADGSGSTLWILEPGSEPRPLTPGSGFFEMKPFFTRDGSRVVFSRHPDAGGPRDVASIAADGGDLRVVLGEPGADEHSGRPSPSRDELAYVSDREGAPQVYLAALDGGEARRLTRTQGAAYAPRWSPDGERLVVTLADSAVLRLVDREALARTRVAVLDRQGRVLLEAPGFMPHWMPPWR